MSIIFVSYFGASVNFRACKISVFIKGEPHNNINVRLFGFLKMLNIGCHLSISKGFADAGKTAVSLGANTFQCFSRNPRGMSAKSISEDDVAEFKKIASDHKFAKILFHAPYILNSCSADPKIRELAFEIMSEDIRRTERYFQNALYVFHPGSHGGQGSAAGINFAIDLLNKVISENQNTIILIETMSGKGTEIGRSFEEIKEIIDGVNFKNKIGVCVDTCHIFAAGYDIKNNPEKVIDEFDRIIGSEKIHAVHLNDSKNPLASFKDGHACIGEGFIGSEAVVNFITQPCFAKIPFFLETPGGLEGFAREISLLKSLYNEKV